VVAGDRRADERLDFGDLAVKVSSATLSTEVPADLPRLPHRTGDLPSSNWSTAWARRPPPAAKPRRKELLEKFATC
jgi:hypothetical protein